MCGVAMTWGSFCRRWLVVGSASKSVEAGAGDASRFNGVGQARSSDQIPAPC